MAISTNAIIMGVILGVLFGVALIVWRRRYRDLFGAFLVVGILALAVVVTIYQVDQFRAQKAEANTLAQTQPAQPVGGSGSSAEPPAKPPIALPTLAPMVRGPSGAAAPAAVHAPYAGNP